MRVHEGGEHWKEEIELDGSRQCTVMSVWAELPDGGEFPNGEVYGADSLKCWASRNWFGVVGSGDFAHYLAGTRVERLRTIKGAFAYAGKRYMAKKEEMPVMEQKPGRYWGVIGREHLPLGKREDREVTASEAVKLRRVMRRYRVANTPPEKRKFLRKSQLWSEDFTAKLFCNVEFWLERLPKLIGLFEGAAIVIRNSGLQEEYTISHPDPLTPQTSPVLSLLALWKNCIKGLTPVAGGDTLAEDQTNNNSKQRKLMTSSSKLTQGIILSVSGWILVILGIALSFTVIGMCLGIPMIVIGMPLWIWGAVWVWQGKVKRAEEAIAAGVRQGIQQAAAMQATAPKVPSSATPPPPTVLPPQGSK